MNRDEERVVNIDIREIEDLEEFMEEVGTSPNDLPTPYIPDVIREAPHVMEPHPEVTGDTETPAGTRSGYKSARWWMGTSYQGLSDVMKESMPTVNEYFRDIHHQLKARALIGQIEQCPTTDRIHAQYVVRFDKTVRMSALKKLRKTDHFEMVRDRQAAMKYCMKSDSRYSTTYVRIGDVPVMDNKKKSESLDWERIYMAAKSGCHDDIPYRIRIQYQAALSKLYHQTQQRIHVSDCVKGIWIYGKPGLGKTRFIMDQYNDPVVVDGTEMSSLYIKSRDKWWDGYSNVYHKTVFVDEMAPKYQASLSSEMKQWADAMSFQAEVKGSKMVPEYQTFFVVSNYSIQEFCGNDQSLKKALDRRFIYMDWNHKDVIMAYLPFKIYESGELLETPDVRAMIPRIIELSHKYALYALGCLAKGFTRRLSMLFISGLGTPDETQFQIDKVGQFVKTKHDVATTGELNRYDDEGL